MKNWVQKATFYHIYPLGFCGAPRFHQEEIQHSIIKVKEWIPHMLALHCNALYLGPVFESYEHGYDTSDYQILDKRLGTNDDFKEVCEALHKEGIHVVLDGVFNHVGRYFWAFQDVQKYGPQSQYCDWFCNLNFQSGNCEGDNFTYEAWENHYNLVKLNLKNEDVIAYLLSCIGKWMDEFHIDGIRLDAADCIDKNFFKRLKKFCKEKNPEFWLMGEIIHGDYNYWANDEMLDSVTNYECYKGLYSSHNEKNYFEIAHSLQRQFGVGGIYSNLTLYNFVDNHDVNRLASTLKDQKDLTNIYTLLYTMPGIPSIYYGSEWALTGKKHDGSDADIRPCINLNEMPDHALYQHLCVLGKIKEENDVLSLGAYEQVCVRNEQFIFKRKNEQEEIIIAMNVSNEAYSYFLQTPYDCVYDALTNTQYLSKHGEIKLLLAPKSSYILLLSKNASKKMQKEHEKIKRQTPTIHVEDTELPLGRYQHFKGKHYSLLYVAKHSETLEKYVVYRQLYGDGSVWIRPLSMFLELVEINGQQVPRFSYLGK
ncbi:MAG: DUF1653 domain-containing protein [Longicatena sp.]